MCISMAAIAAVTLVTSAVQAYSTVTGANANKSAAQYSAALEKKQLTERARLARLEALQAESARSSEFQRIRSAAFAAIGASGMGENITFLQGIDPEQQRAWLQDTRNIRLGLVQSESDIRDRIQVSAFGARIAAFNAAQSKIGAMADFAKTAMQAASFMNAYGTPKGGGVAKAGAGGTAHGFGFGNSPGPGLVW